MRGDFTKDEATDCMSAAQEMHAALPRGRQAAFSDHLNDLLLFLDAARSAAPSEVEPEPGSGSSPVLPGPGSRT